MKVMADPETRADDAALVRSYVERNDRAALGELFSRHADAAYRTALRACRNAADAEDAVQAAFTEILRHAAKFRGESAVRPWILGFVVNACRHKAREEGRRDVREERAARGEAAPAGDPETRDAVRRAVQELPEHYRVPVWLHYCEGLSSGEVAQSLSLSENTVRSQLSRGVDQLRSALAGMSGAALVGVLGTIASETAPAALSASVAGIAANAAPVKAGLLAKSAAIAMACAAAVSTAAVLWVGLPDPPPPLPPELSWIEERVREWQPRPEEKRFDEIAWAESVPEALRLAREHARPVFLLAHVGTLQGGRADGGSMDVRARALSDPAVIEVLNRRFVPVYSRSDSPDVRPVYRDCLEKKLGGGDEWIYLLDPAGRVVDAVSACHAAPKDLLARLEKIAVPPGAPLAVPRAQVVPPAADGVVLHLTARYLDRSGGPSLSPGYAYGAFPAEDFLVLPHDAFAGEIDPAVAAKLLSRIYPLTGNFRGSEANAVEEASLTARPLVSHKSVAWIRLDGRVRLSHTFFPDREPKPVEARVAGFVQWDPAARRVRSLRLVTEGATYGKDLFGVAVRSVP
jgi:RNA polymerase sigma-70 factor (ECF subfamily)